MCCKGRTFPSLSDLFFGGAGSFTARWGGEGSGYVPAAFVTFPPMPFSAPFSGLLRKSLTFPSFQSWCRWPIPEQLSSLPFKGPPLTQGVLFAFPPGLWRGGGLRSPPPPAGSSTFSLQLCPGLPISVVIFPLFFLPFFRLSPPVRGWGFSGLSGRGAGYRAALRQLR